MRTMILVAVLLAGCATAEPEPAATTEVATTATEVATTSTPTTEPEPSPTAEYGSRENPIVWGDFAEFTDWAATVDDVTIDDTVTVTMTVTYLGDTEGNPSLGIQPTIAGSDLHQYEPDTGCTFDTDTPMPTAPTLEPGGTYTGTWCFDVPANALNAGADLFLEPAMNVERMRGFWQLRPE